MDFTPMPGAAGEREAVARAMACEDLGYLTPFMQSNWLERADRAISALAPRRAAEILAAEARGYADAEREIASWLYDGDTCECCGCMSIAASEVERGEHRKAGK